MAEFKLNEAIQQVRTLFAEMSLMKKATILVTVGISLAVFMMVWDLSTKSSYQVLFSNLKSEDTGEIAAALDKFKIPYQIQSEAQSILVPGDKVLETRLKLAKDGLPRFGGIG